jgi:hypothetical protein
VWSKLSWNETVTSFEKVSILQVLREFNSTEQQEDSYNQLKLFDLWWDTSDFDYKT